MKVGRHFNHGFVCFINVFAASFLHGESPDHY
jgi:hypothetical protein